MSLYEYDVTPDTLHLLDMGDESELDVCTAAGIHERYSREEHVITEEHARMNGDLSVTEHVVSWDEGEVMAPEPPPLPEGKLFHAFLSHNSEPDEREYVLQVMDTLEARPYQLKCCFADRDFLAGKPITTSIEHRLEESVSAVFFLTPSFIDSEFCKQEHLIAQQMAFLRGSQFRIIPVLLKDCKLPARFECITYLDARGKSPRELIEDPTGLYYALTNEQFWNELSKELISWDQRETNAPCMNGNFLTLPIVNYTTCSKDYVIQSVFDSDTRRICSTMGLDLSVSDYSDIVELIKNAPMITHSFVVRPLKSDNFSFFAMLTAIGLHWIYLWFLVDHILCFFALLDCSERSIAVTSLGAIFFLIIFWICGFVWKSNRLQKKVWSANDAYFDKLSVISTVHRHFMLTRSVANPGQIELIQYDTKLCLRYICKELLKFNNVTDEDKTKNEQMADEIMTAALPGYLTILRKREHQTIRIRHPVRGRLLCLCQYVELYDYYKQYTADVEQSEITAQDNSESDEKELLPVSPRNYTCATVAL